MLRESLAMGAAFGFLVFFPKGKLWNGASLLIAGLIMGLGAGQSPRGVAENFTGIVTSPPTMKTIAVILQIGVLSALMKQYDILGRLVEAFEDVFSSTKAVIMILPAAIGMVSVPGGAAISSPFVDELGDSLRLPVFKRAALNLTFRHCAFFLLPTSSSMIVFSNMAPHVSLYKLIALSVAFVPAWSSRLTCFICAAPRRRPLRAPAADTHSAGSSAFSNTCRRSTSSCCSTVCSRCPCT